MKILYLGLRPKEGTVHYPVIRTVKLPYTLPQNWQAFTHIVFTSQEAVNYWEGPWDKETVAIGEATAKVLAERGCKPLIAPFATQEGVFALLQTLKGIFFWPRSRLSRSMLIEACRKVKIPLFPLDLYDTRFQRLEPMPKLEDFDEIIFTSPSTVEGFLRIYGSLPQGKRLTPIGPVTEKALRSLT